MKSMVPLVRGFKVLTDIEVQALSAVLDKAIAEADDGDPEFQEVAAADVNPFGDKLVQSNVYDTLSKRGFIECSGSADTDEGDGKVECVCITPAGLEALKDAKGVH